MVAGPSAAGKSAFVTWLVNEWDVPSLYFSADMNAHDMATRLAALRSGDTANQVSEALSRDEGGRYDQALAGSKIVFNFQSTPSMNDVLGELDAYVEVYDRYPEVIVLDNLKNFASEDDYKELTAVCADAHEIARRTSSLVVLLHHMQEGGTRPLTVPQSRKGLKYKLSEFPENILSVAVDGDTFKVAPVKLRMGKCDPSGDTMVQLRADISRCTFSSIQFEYHVPDGVESWWQK